MSIVIHSMRSANCSGQENKLRIVDNIMVPQSLVTIKRSEVPSYLHVSKLFQSFEGEEDDEITIPINCLKLTLDMNSLLDFDHLFRTVRFWILDPYPDVIFHILAHYYGDEVDQILSGYENTTEQRAFLRRLQNHHLDSRIVLAIECGQADFVDYFIRTGARTSTDLLEFAARCGNLDCLTSIHNCVIQQHPAIVIPSDLLQDLIDSGHASCLAFLLSAKKIILFDSIIVESRWGIYHWEEAMSALSYAAKNNQVECFLVLLSHTRKTKKSLAPGTMYLETWKEAMNSSDLACFHILMNECAIQVKTDSSLFTVAREAGNEEVLRLLSEQGCPEPMEIEDTEQPILPYLGPEICMDTRRNAGPGVPLEECESDED